MAKDQYIAKKQSAAIIKSDIPVSNKQYSNCVKTALIATHPLGSNYGGIMQAYALQQALNGLGVDSYSVYYDFRLVKRLIRQIVKRFFLIHRRELNINNKKYKRYYQRQTQKFIFRYIKLIPPNTTTRLVQDAIIVGSDQVWRAKYVPVLKYLLDFSMDLKLIRISYAASFGKDDLSEYNIYEKKAAKQLAQCFDAISVREDSGVKIVKDEWGLKAEHHVDPTLLLDKTHYEKLITKVKLPVTKNAKVFAYIIDREPAKTKIIDKISKHLNTKSFEVMPPKPFSKKEFMMNLEKYQLPPVEHWIAGFRDADFIVTDSFHGCVFSIIFNKPFIAIGNKARGLTRFTSLLKMFGLEDRLVDSSDEVPDKLINSSIDWTKINAKIKKEQKRSIDYLEKYLGQPRDKR